MVSVFLWSQVKHRVYEHDCYFIYHPRKLSISFSINFFFSKFYLCFLDELVRILFLTSVLMFAYCWELVSK